MNEIIKVNTDTQTVSARDLHETLQIEKRFSAWFEQFKDIFTEGDDFTSVLTSTEVQNNGGVQIRELQDYIISIDMAKHICMMSHSEKGKECRQYFIDLEKAWNTPEQIMARALKVADAQIISLKDRCNFLGSQIEEKSQLIESLQPKAAYYDLVLQCNTLLSTTEIAKDYGMSARKFNDLLHEMGIQFKQSDRWFLYTRYEGCGYTSSKTTNFVRKDGSLGCATNMYWTPKGRLFLYDSLKSDAILPMIEREIA